MNGVRLPVVTVSAMRCFRRCNREFYNSYTLGYRPVTQAETLRFGSLIHRGLEAWWLAKQAGDAEPLARVVETLRTFAADEYDAARAGVLMQGYDARWYAEPLEVLAVEAQFNAPLVNPDTGATSRTYALAGKIDAVVRDLRDGLTKLVESKTTSEDVGAGSDYWKRLTIDPQVSTYFAGGRALGYDIAECIYDVIKKPALRPSQVALLDGLGAKIVLDANGERVKTQQGRYRQTGDAALGYVLQTRDESADEFRARLLDHIAENPDRYYQRGSVVRLEQEEADAAYDTWHTARMIREAELAGRWPRSPDACVRYSRLCGYFSACTGTASIDDPALFHRVENVHSELSETPDAA